MTKYGKPETVLKFTKNLSTTPLIKNLRPNEILVKLHACSVNKIDCKIRNGAYFNTYYPSLPHILGKDGSGVVVKKGERVTNFKIGDKVLGTNKLKEPCCGTYAEYTIFKEQNCCLKPEGVTHLQGAALSVGGLAAYQILNKIGRIKKGARVLVHGATGGIGHIVCQVAKSLGAEVWGSCNTDSVGFLKSLNVDVCIDYTKGNISNAIQQDHLDLVVDVIGNISKEIEGCVKKSGHIVSLSNYTYYSNFTKKFLSFFEGPVYHYPTIRPDGKILAKVAQLVADGKIEVNIQQVFPLEKISTAHKILEKGKVCGKIILDIGGKNIPKGKPKKKIETKKEISQKAISLVKEEVIPLVKEEEIISLVKEEKPKETVKQQEAMFTHGLDPLGGDEIFDEI